MITMRMCGAERRPEIRRERPSERRPPRSFPSVARSCVRYSDAPCDDNGRRRCRVWNPARRAPRQTTHACAPHALFPASASRSAALVRVSAPVQAPSQLRVRDACDVDTAPEAPGRSAAAEPSLAGRGVVVSNRFSLTASSRILPQHRTESFTACSRTQVGACRPFAPA